jgi:serine protease Do
MRKGKFGIGKWLPFSITIMMLITLAACTPMSSTVAPAATAPSVTLEASPVPPVDFTTAVAKVMPSMVVIEVEIVTQTTSGQPTVQPAAGSGWVVDANGLIVTNNHVVEGTQTITITLVDGRKFTAIGVQTNATEDLAVVKINAQNLQAATIGDSSKLKLGQPVAVIGNALDLGTRVTGGMVSLLDVSINLPNNQTASHLIETDAAINPGNSGGVLITDVGDVVGIINAGLSDPRIDPEAFGYAIPINEAMPIINQLISQMP